MASQVKLREVARRAAVRPNHRSCRICGQKLPAPFIDLGRMPLANAFLASPDDAAEERTYPLAAACCATCGLVQINHVVPAEQLYRNYIYVSSTSQGVRAHAEWLAAEMVQRYGWGRADLLVEVASNDGTVLKAFQRAGLQVLGVEPAANVAAAADADGVPTIPQFFTAESARDLVARHGRAACILGRHVFGHVDNLHDFLEGVETLLADDGVFLIEVPYLGDLLSDLEFDTIYHEHLSYFALEPVIRLCRDHGLALVDVDRLLLHGGSVLLHIRRRHHGATPSRALAEMLETEWAARLTSPETLQRFAEAVQSWRDQLTDCVEGLHQGGARLIGYGAAAKANTLLSYCPSVAKTLGCILDRSPHKQGRFTPGTHIEVKPVEHWAESGATHMLILAWNFKEEIMEQMKPFADRGGRFVIPIPEPEVV